VAGRQSIYLNAEAPWRGREGERKTSEKGKEQSKEKVKILSRVQKKERIGGWCN